MRQDCRKQAPKQEPAVRAPLTSGFAVVQNLSAGLPSGQICHDEQRLEVIFADLARHKDDAQQRSWALYEDENVICCYLEELLRILVSKFLSLQPEHCRDRAGEVTFFDLLHRCVATGFAVLGKISCTSFTVSKPNPSLWALQCT